MRALFSFNLYGKCEIVALRDVAAECRTRARPAWSSVVSLGAVVGVIMFSVRRSRVFNEMIWWEQINSVECAPTERIWFDVVMPIIICRPQQLERTIEPA